MMSAIYAAIDIWRRRRQYDELQAGKMIEKPSADDRDRRPGRPQIA